MAGRHLHPKDYTVGWVCALPVELAAAQKMLDEVHQDLPQDALDTNLYTLGHIGEHNVVIACLPAGQPGTNSAATVAVQMKFKFASIRFSLMVGIGGGVPSAESDVRLGDVVISQPHKGHGGVVQYDFGKTTPGEFERTGFLNAPPTILLSALAKLRANHLGRDRRLSIYLSALDHLPEFARNNAGHDILFEPTYSHVEGPICEMCSENRLVARPLRGNQETLVHYGTVASGNQVMRDGVARDRVSSELGGVLCFEMEAAGLMNSFPCLVIRGICDYADSHKNKRWQSYAAATAAACAKEILSVIPADKVATTRTVDEALKSKEESLPLDDRSLFLALSKRPEWDLAQEGIASYNIFEHISDYEPDLIFEDYLRKRCPRTTTWILKDERFIAWLENRSHPCIWLSGKIGCGKTLVTSTVVQYAIQETQKTSDLVAQFFYSHSDKSRLKAVYLFRSYIKQILGYLDIIGKPCPLRIISYVKRFYGPKRCHPGFEETIDNIFIPLSELLPSTIYVVDGLDECEPKEVRKVLKTFRQIMSPRGPRVYISGREGLDVTNAIPDSNTICLSNEDNRDNREDICRFIEWRIEEKMRERQITEKNCVLQDIKSKLNERADQMILWVGLQLEALWDECSTDADIRKALANLPKDLSETYDRCLTSISRQHSRFAPKILRWVCAAIRPFKFDQLREALAIDADTGCLDGDNMPSPKELLKCCSNLIIRDNNNQILLTHHSVRQFLEDRRADARLFPTGFELNAAVLELGELCVAHLTSRDYALSLQACNASKDPRFNLSPKAVEKLVQPIPSWMRFATPKPRSVQISFIRKASRVPPATELPSFFYFAKEQWAPLTHGIVKDSNGWHKFQTLALEPNLSWRWHPWEPIGESLDSHFSGLLGWAVANHHLPLIYLLFDSQTPKPRADIFNLPLSHHSNLPALHLASRMGEIEITRRLLQVCNPKKTDNKSRTALHHAAERGHTDIVLLLAKKKANLKAKDDKWQTALHLAAGNGHEAAIQALIEIGADVSAKDNKGWTALFTAAQNGHGAIVQVLVQLGANVNAKDNAGRTALYTAAENGHEAMIQVLIQLGANVNARNDAGRTALDITTVRVLAELGADVNTKDDANLTPLLMAAQKGHEAIVSILFQLGAEANVEDNGGRTPLSWAVQNGHEAVVKLLLEKGAELETKSNYGRTPLSWAAENGHEAVVKLLLEKGAELETKDKNRYGQTPLSWAAENGHEAVVKLLLEKGAGLETKDKNRYGQTPLSWAAENGHEAVVKLLLEKGAELETRSSNGQTPLSWAAENGHEAVVKLLLEKGAGLETKDQDGYGQTPLSWAAQNGHEAVVKLLLEKGAELETRSSNGQTPLSWAAENGHEAVVKLLLEKGAGLETKDQDGYGRTPLSWAAQNGHEAVVKLLLEKGAGLETRSSNGRTPLSWAAESGHEAVVKLLLEKGAGPLQTSSRPPY